MLPKIFIKTILIYNIIHTILDYRGAAHGIIEVCLRWCIQGVVIIDTTNGACTQIVVIRILSYIPLLGLIRCDVETVTHSAIWYSYYSIYITFIRIKSYKEVGCDILGNEDGSVSLNSTICLIWW